MTIEEYVKTLDPNHSYWLADNGDTKRLNDVEPTAENLCIVFACYNCTRLYHAIPYTDLKIDNDGDYLVFCPENKEGGYETWIFRCNVPEELQTLFDKADLETYVDPEDEDEDIKVNTKITKKGKIKITNLDNFLLYRIVKVFYFI